MTIKVNAVERKLKFEAGENGKYEYRYVMKAEMYNKLTQSKVISEASARSGISKGNLNAAWEAIGDVVCTWATEGHSVAIPGLGTMRFGLRSKSVTNVNDVASSLITSRRVIFTPNVDIKNELKNTGIAITCIDRNGNVVKRVSAEVTDPSDFKVTLTAVPEEGGTVEGAGFYNDGDIVTLKATPKPGYKFEKWSDGETESTRSFTITEDIELQASFIADNTGGGGADLPNEE